MTAVHYCTFGGADNRGHYLHRSYELCQSWFDGFYVSDTGATDDTYLLSSDNLGDPRVHYKYIPGDYFALPSWKDLVEQVIADIPDGDWFLFMDSDERPAPSLLHQLRKAIALAEKVDCCQYLITGLMHINGATEQPLDEWLARIPATEEAYCGSGTWVKGNLLRKVPELRVEATGPHFGFRVDEHGPSRYLPGAWYNHYGTTSDQVMKILRACWAIGYLRTFGVPEDSEEVKWHDEIVTKSGLLTPNELIAAIREDRLPGFVHEYLRSLATSPYYSLRVVSEAATRWNYQSNCRDDCGNACCRYCVS